MKPTAAAKLRGRWVSTALIAALGCATSGPIPDQPEVRSLRIEGAKKVSESELKSKILTSESGSWPFGEKHYFDLNAWHADLRRILRVYESEGYYNARIVDMQIISIPARPVEAYDEEGVFESTRQQLRVPASVDLKVRVEEGPPTHIAKIGLSGFGALPPEHHKEALSDLPVKEGQIFKENAWESTKGEVRSTLRELGYAEAVVRGQALVDIAKDEADLRIESDVGQRYRFGDVFVSINPHPRTPISWVREQAEGAVKKGTWFSNSALAEAQARVFKMGVFGAVKVNAGAPDRPEGTLPVVVDVRESPFHSLRLGGGAGFDQTRNELRLIGEYIDRDFFGGLRRFTLRGKVGWAFIPNIISVLAQSQTVALKSEPIYSASAELEQPRAFSKNIRLLAALTSQRDAQQAYSFIGGGGRLGLVWQPHSTFSISFTYNLDAEYLLSGQTTLGGQAPQLFYGCPANEVNCLIVLSYLEQAIVWDRRDNIVDPRQGFFVGLSFQEGGGPLGGSFAYYRIVPEGRYYYSFPKSKQYTIAARIKLGTLKPLGSGSSPITTRFFSGGDAMRGFNYQRLSPLLIVAQNPNQTLQDGVAAPLGLQGVTVPIGGNGLFESSLEFRYNFTRSNFVLATFFDTGFVTPDDIVAGVSNQGFKYFTQNMLFAIGVGVRYRTPIGPIRFDLGRRLNIGPSLSVTQQNPNLPLNPPSPQKGFFGLDSGFFHFISGPNQPGDAGYPEAIWAFHLSIGEAF
jgi:translocation and assembly module TamA